MFVFSQFRSNYLTQVRFLQIFILNVRFPILHQMLIGVCNSGHSIVCRRAGVYIKQLLVQILDPKIWFIKNYRTTTTNFNVKVSKLPEFFLSISKKAKRDNHILTITKNHFVLKKKSRNAVHKWLSHSYRTANAIYWQN